MKKRADEFFAKMQQKANSFEELGKALQKGGFVKVPLCSRANQGKACADEIKAKTHGDVRGTLFEEERASGKCIVCGKDATALVYVGRQY